MTSTIAADQVVSIHYTLTGENNEVLDSSEGQEPLVYLHGHGQIIPGLENDLVGKKAGDKFKVSIEPKDGYGEYHAELTKVVKKDLFPKRAPIEVDGCVRRIGCG